MTTDTSVPSEMMMSIEQYVREKRPTTAVFDLDGTLLGPPPERKLTEVSRCALRQLRAHNIDIIIATGRPWVTVEPFWADLESNYPLICVDGRVVYDPKNGCVLHSKSLDADIADRVREMVGGIAYVLLETATHLWVPDAKAAFMARIALGRPRRSIICGNPDPSEEPILHLYLAARDVASPLDDCWADKITGRLDGKGSVYRAGTHWLLVSLPGQSYPSFKHESLLWLCNSYHLSPERMIVFGDGENDLGLFRLAGFAVAPANALETVKRHAHVIAQQEYGLGVQEIVSKWVALIG